MTHLNLGETPPLLKKEREKIHFLAFFGKEKKLFSGDGFPLCQHVQTIGVDNDNDNDNEPAIKCLEA